MSNVAVSDEKNKIEKAVSFSVKFWRGSEKGLFVKIAVIISMALPALSLVLIVSLNTGRETFISHP